MVPGRLLYDRCDGETNHQEVTAVDVGFLVVTFVLRFFTRLVPLDVLDLQGNEGLQMAMAAVPPQEFQRVAVLRDAFDSSATSRTL